MRHIVFLALVAAITAASPARAQLFRAYLASYGADTNPCTLTAPCRLLPQALANVADGGEIWMLDSANYNTSTVYVSKSVSIQAVPGQVGSIVSTGGGTTAGMALLAAGGKVALRNLAFVSMATSPGWRGVLIASNGGGNLPPATVSIEDCSFTGLPGQAVYILGAAVVHVKKSLFRDIGESAVLAEDGARVDVSTSHLLSTGGVVAYSGTAGRTSVSLSDSEVAGGSNPSASISATASGQGAIARLYVSGTTVHDMATALQAVAADGGQAAMYVGKSTITHNMQAIHVSFDATIYSLGDNLIADNASADFGALTPISAR